MAKVEFELNHEGIRELLKSDEVGQMCEGYADRALGSLGKGYAKKVRVAPTRVYAKVYARSKKAKAENLEENLILKALR